MKKLKLQDRLNSQINQLSVALPRKERLGQQLTLLCPALQRKKARSQPTSRSSKLNYNRLSENSNKLVPKKNKKNRMQKLTP
jgi:hypothetical protein